MYVLYMYRTYVSYTMYNKLVENFIEGRVL